MICFTSHTEVYNFLIHHFLEIEGIKSKECLDFLVEVTLPENLVREQYKKCRDSYLEVYKLTKNKKYIPMTAFHKVVIYYFINYLKYIQKDDEDFLETYFDDECHNIINQEIEECLKEQEDYEECDKIPREYYEDSFYDLYEYFDNLFADLDFLDIENLYNQKIAGNDALLKHLGIKFEDYLEILPLDIQKALKKTHLTLSYDLEEFILFVIDRVNNGSLSKMFWNEKKAVSLKQIQIIIDNLIATYYENENIELNWESFFKEDSLYFELFKSRDEDKKALLFLEKVDKEKLIDGYTNNLMNISKQYEYSLFFIICFTDEEYELTKEFINTHIYKDLGNGYISELYLNLNILDVRNKKSASKR